MAWTVEDAAVGDELRRGAWMAEDTAAGNELRRGADGGRCGRRRRAPAWDVDGGTTGDDALVLDSDIWYHLIPVRYQDLIPRKYHPLRGKNRMILDKYHLIPHKYHLIRGRIA
uniref:Uncharacterized protein n=1 Tax=Oryza rufipogon TaxID=4529 RepID=A0A0E0PCB6_ORYRU